MGDETIIFTNINLIYIHSVTAAALTKICLDKQTDVKFIFFSWIPFLNFFTIGMLSKRTFGDIFFSVALLSVFTLIVSSVLSGVFVKNPIIFFPFILIFSGIQGIIFWEEIIHSGGFKRKTTLAVLAGTPIISLFVLIYIALKGKWS